MIEYTRQVKKYPSKMTWNESLALSYFYSYLRLLAYYPDYCFVLLSIFLVIFSFGKIVYVFWYISIPFQIEPTHIFDYLVKFYSRVILLF